MILNYTYERGANFQFDKQEMMNFYRRLPNTDRFYNIEAKIEDKIALVCIDDFMDEDTSMLLNIQEIPFTLFSLGETTSSLISEKGEVQSHFNKDNPNILQLLTGGVLANRNHRFWWRSDNLDFAFLSMMGFKVDSSKPGIKPYMPVIQGKILPIWEVPYSVYEFSQEDSIHAGYRIGFSHLNLMSQNITPITTCHHPISLQLEHKFNSNLFSFISDAREYGYKFMTMTQFYNEILKSQEKIV